MIAKFPLIVVAAVTAWAQAPDPFHFFPSDTQKPANAGGAALLEAVCPGQVTTGSGISCRAGCPDYTELGRIGDTAGWSLAGVVRGHFLSATSDDAALWMEGCEPHSENFGGTILLTRRAGKWAMDWYKAGVETSRCRKLQLESAREILVCIGASGGQGNVVTEIYVEDLVNPAPVLMADDDSGAGVFAVFDDTQTCGANDDDKGKPFAIISSRIDRVEFSKGPLKAGSFIAVTASLGHKAMMPNDVDACQNKRLGWLPPTTAYRMEFIFDGQAYQASAGTAKFVQLFSYR